jgi:hypothetical protein
MEKTENKEGFPLFHSRNSCCDDCLWFFFAAPIRIRPRQSRKRLNVFDHPQFRGLDTGVDDATFGDVTSANAAREIQLSMRLNF